MKKVFSICIKETDDAHAFAESAERFCSDIDLICGRYIVNAKSILGVLSLLSERPMTVEIHSDDEEEIGRFAEAMRVFEASAAE